MVEFVLLVASIAPPHPDFRDLLRQTQPLSAPSAHPRYAEPWLDDFRARVRPALVPGVRILDVGSGRHPTIPLSERPEGCSYVGFDISRRELAAAPAGSYDESIAADIGIPRSDLMGRFDLVVSWQVLEHVPSLGDAVENQRTYLRPRGRMIFQLSGRYSLYAIVNRMVPTDLGIDIVSRVMRRNPTTVFPSYYDDCYDSALRRLLSNWSEVEIVPRYRGAAYLQFAAYLQKLYLAYEDWAATRGKRNLATHYIVDAMR